MHENTIETMTQASILCNQAKLTNMFLIIDILNLYTSKKLPCDNVHC